MSFCPSVCAFPQKEHLAKSLAWFAITIRADYFGGRPWAARHQARR
jgi:hypothetical protein